MSSNRCYWDATARCTPNPVGSFLRHFDMKSRGCAVFQVLYKRGSRQVFIFPTWETKSLLPLSSYHHYHHHRYPYHQHHRRTMHSDILSPLQHCVGDFVCPCRFPFATLFVFQCCDLFHSAPFHGFSRHLKMCCFRNNSPLLPWQLWRRRSLRLTFANSAKPVGVQWWMLSGSRCVRARGFIFHSCTAHNCVGPSPSGKLTWERSDRHFPVFI